MPLGLLAKDSIQDLAALGREADHQELSQSSNSSRKHGGSSNNSLSSQQSEGGDVKQHRNDHPDSGDKGDQEDVVIERQKSVDYDDDDDDDLLDAGAMVDTAEDQVGPNSVIVKNKNKMAGSADSSSTPQKPKVDDPQSSYGKYSGFDVNTMEHPYYQNYADLRAVGYATDSYSPLFLGSKPPTENKIWQCLLPCIFPWTQQQPPAYPADHHLAATPSTNNEEDDLDGDEKFFDSSSVPVENGSSTATPIVSNKTNLNSTREDDEVSNSSDALGEKLSEKERQAVLARLGLAQPDDPAVVTSDLSDRGGGAGSHGDNFLDAAAGAHSNSSTAVSPTDHKNRSQNGLLNGIPNYNKDGKNGDSLLVTGENKPLRGILKKRSVVNIPASARALQQQQASSNSLSSSGGGGSSGNLNKENTPKRRALFPSYENKPMNPKHNYHVAFAPMARVVTVKSKNDMSPEEKSDIWWVKSDYEDFRKTGRIITKAMLEGGSEIWLASNESWQAANQSRGGSLKTALSLADGDGSQKGKNKTRDSTPKRPNRMSASASSPSSSLQPDSDAGDTISATGDKWWHKFGHSRRGLEHVVSMEEGKQRQQNVKNAIRAVLEEQTRQKLYNRVDAEKLRIVSLTHTSWARDLALAAGSSDADAVQSSFAEDRKSREFYLHNMVKSNPTINNGRHLPEFMQPVMHGLSSGNLAEGGLAMQARLDANTAAQIKFRRRQAKDLVEPSNGIKTTTTTTSKLSSASLSSSASSVSSSGTSVTSASSVDSERAVSSTTTIPSVAISRAASATNETCEPVHDPVEADNKEKLSQRAAGFTSEGDAKVNIAAVLSGMGAVPQEPRTVVA